MKGSLHISGSNRLRHPLFLPVTAFCLGLAAALKLPLDFRLAYVLALCSWASCLLFAKWRFSGPLILLLCFLAGLSYYTNDRSLAPEHVLNLCGGNAGSCILSGEIIYLGNNGREDQLGIKVFSFQQAGINYKSRGKVLLKAPGNSFSHKPGTRLVCKGYFQPAESFYRGNRYLINNNLSGTFSLSGEPVITGQPPAINQHRWWVPLRQYYANILGNADSPISSAVIKAMVLGDKGDIPLSVSDSMIKCGTIHILVVSGFNVGIVAFIVLLGLKIMRLDRKAVFFCCLPCIVSYCFITGACTPVVRATLMALAFVLACAINREPDIYNSSALSALLILLYNPRQICDIGFLLSFASVLSIVTFYPLLKKLFNAGEVKPRILKLLLEGFLVSLSAWAGTVLIIAFNFRIISLSAPLINVAVVPLASFITLSAICQCLLWPLVPKAAAYISIGNEAIVALLIKINLFCAGLPWSYIKF